MAITLETLEACEAQELFDQIVEHLLKQNKRSVNAQNEPAYYGLDGCKCPVGSLIPEDKYQKDFEGKGFYYVLLKLSLPRAYEWMMDRFEDIHYESPPEQWGDELKAMAIDMELSLTRLEELTTSRS